MTIPADGKLQWQKWSTLIGSFLAFLPNGLSMYWGNLSVYVYSFIYVIKNVDPLQNQAPWLISLYTISRNIGVISTRKICQCLGHRVTMLLAISFFNTGLILSFWAVNYSTWTLNISLGVLTGLGNGVLHATIMIYVINWSESHMGFLTSAVMTGYSVGSALTNEGITLYVNPTNEDADNKDGPIMYFSQINILRAVPTVFLFLALFSGSFHFLGCLLIRPSNPHSIPSREQISVQIKDIKDCAFPKQRIYSYKRSSFSDPQSLEEGTQQIQPFLPDDDNPKDGLLPCSVSINETNLNNNSVTKIGNDDLFLQFSESNHDSHRNILNSTHYPGITVSQKRCENQEYDADLENSESADEVNCNYSTMTLYEEGQNKYNPLELFCAKEFYVLLSMIVATDTASLILSTYYKTFGQSWIDNDHFLTNLGMLLAFASTSARLTWGFVVDKFGVKIPTLLSTLSLTVVSSVYYFTPALSKWLFLACTLMFGCANSALFTCFYVGTIKLLGKTYFSTNYGMLSFSTIVLNLLAPLLIETILIRHGWILLFLGTGFTALVSLVMVLILMPSR